MGGAVPTRYPTGAPHPLFRRFRGAMLAGASGASARATNRSLEVMHRRVAIFAAVLFLTLTGGFTRAGDSRAAAPPEEERRSHLPAVWIFEAGGEGIGEHRAEQVTRELPDGSTQRVLRGYVRIGPPGSEPAPQVFELWSDGEGRPVRYDFAVLSGDDPVRLEVRFRADGSDVRLIQAGATRAFELSGAPSPWVLTNNALSHLERIAAAHDPGQDHQVRVFSGNALNHQRYRLRWDGEFERDGPEGTTLRGERWRDTFGGMLEMVDGRLERFEMPAQAVVARREAAQRVEIPALEPFDDVWRAAAAPAEPDPEDPFLREELRAESGGATLAGELTRPRAAAADERLPAVLFLSGSGAQDRHGRSAGLELGTREILDHLTGLGFAVLRTDDRGTGASDPAPEGLGYEDLLAEARAWLALLGKRGDVDPKRIALVGHSEGALTALVLAAEAAGVAAREEEPAPGVIAAVALLAAPGRPLLEVMVEQNRDALAAAGLSGDELERELAAVRELLTRFSGPDEIDPDELPDQARALLPMRRWLQDHARYDPRRVAARVRAPVLILQGDTDFQVSPERDAEALAAAFAAAEHPDATLRRFPGLDHLFKRTPGKRSTLADYALERPVAPEFLAALGDWIAERLVGAD